ncbi:AAA family ATPase [Rummeliibacillus pycnus]|uniref:AAA family ATPase n=1 Tax=Rummeliibacillus pycnus TaxID=101070 RepID=UPI003D2C9780
MTNILRDIQNYLNNKFIEREAEIEGILVALLARQHILLIGEAGTGKSALSTELAKIIDGSNYFQWLLTRFSTPEEVFGALSLKDLEQGVYARNVANKMPEAHISFLDEIFKANSAILNALLTIINERIFYNNGKPIQVPLMSVVGASNEYPEENEGLEALFDRFLLRYEVEYIQDAQNFVAMMQNKGQFVNAPKMTLDELEMAQFAVDNVVVPTNVVMALASIREDLKTEGIRPSDRRFKQSLSILQAKAYLEGRTSVQLSDIQILENSLWQTVDQKDKTKKIITLYAQDKVDMMIKESLSIVEELKDNVLKNTSTELVLETTKKIKEIRQNIIDYRNKHRSATSNEDDQKLESCENTIQTILREVVDLSLTGI